MRQGKLAGAETVTAKSHVIDCEYDSMQVEE